MEALAGKLDRVRLGAAEAVVVGRDEIGDARPEPHRVQIADFCQLASLVGVVCPGAGVDRPGDDDQPAGLLGDPGFEEIDLPLVEHAPVEIEGDQRVVLAQFGGADRKFVEHQIGVLNDALAGRLQEYVDGGAFVAMQHVSQETELARGAARQQQHTVGSVDNFDKLLALVVAGVGVFLRRVNLERVQSAAGGRPAVAGNAVAGSAVIRNIFDLEFDRHFLAVVAEGDLLDALRSTAALRRACADIARGEFDRDRTALQSIALHDAGDLEAVARIGAGRGAHVAQGHIHRPVERAHADAEYLDSLGLGQGNRRLPIHAGVQPAIGDDDDSREGRVAEIVNPAPQGVAQSSFVALGSERGGPVDRLGRRCRERSVNRLRLSHTLVFLFQLLFIPI